MARKAIIQESIMKVLESSGEPLRPKDIKGKVEALVGRSIFLPAISAAIKPLMANGLIEKRLYKGRIAYALSNQFHKQAIKDFLRGLVESFGLSELEANFSLGNERLPNVIHISPLMPDEHDVCDLSDLKMSVSIDWHNPSSAISSIICNDYLLLASEIREGIANLLIWAYWIAIQDKKQPSNFDEIKLPSSMKQLENAAKYSSEIAVWAKKNGDSKRSESEEATIKILNITLELLKKDNLFDFLEYAESNKQEVMSAQQRILSLEGHFMARGENTFRDLVDNKNEVVLDGFSSIEENIGKTNELHSIFKEPELSFDEVVWNEFLTFIFEIYSQSFTAFSGSFEEAMGKVKKYYVGYKENLVGLFKHRKAVAIYFWNVPVKRESEKYLKLPEFEEWRKALDSGNLSHRVWLFEEETIRDVEKAYRAVRGGRVPKTLKIDKEFWTLRDIYELHPKGKDPEFWHELVKSLKAQIGKDPFRGGPVPKEVYYDLIKRQREAAREFMGRKEDV